MRRSWGWYIDTQPELIYGAHDFDGGEGNEVRIRALPTSTDDRWRLSSQSASRSQLRFEAVVVNQTHASFYQDAVLISHVPLPRPVTDCSGSALHLGGEGMVLARHCQHVSTLLGFTRSFFSLWPGYCSGKSLRAKFC